MIGSMEPSSIRLSESDAQTFGYWVDLGDVQLDEGTGSWIQAMPYGTWEHPVHGNITFDVKRAQRFADNVNSNVRGQELDIDYDHKEKTGEAAGWVKKAEARSDGLYLFVDWTKDAFDKIKNKAYRYFSPEFVDQWKHPQTGQKHQDVVFGGALTNRPFLKGILPINLSELTGNEPSQEESNVDRAFLEQLAKKFDIEFADSTSDEDLSKAIADYEPPAPDTSNDGGGSDDPTSQGANQPEPVLASERLKKLAETDPEIATMLAEQAQQRKAIEALTLTSKKQEIKVKLSELDTDKYRLTPVAKKKLSDILIEVPISLNDKIVDLVKDVMKDGVVRLGELGSTNGSGNQASETPAADAFEAEVKKLMDGNKDLEYADAVVLASREHGDLYDQYREESFSFKEA